MWPNTIMRRYGAIVVPIQNRTVLLPQPDVTTPRAAGQPPYFGGFNMSFALEGNQLAESEPSFKQVELCRWALAGYVIVSRAVLLDCDVMPWLAPQIAHSVGWLEEYNFFQGNGIGRPMGIINSPASISITRNTANKFLAADAEAMIAKLPPGSYENAVWAMSVSALGANGWAGLTNLVPNLPDLKLYGRPVIPTDVLPPLGTKGDVCLVDPSFCAIAQGGQGVYDEMEGRHDLGDIEIAISEHPKFINMQYIIRVIRRIDGQPILDKALTLGDGTSTASPFVILNY
jgi:HK97 family phage major capsid protein